MRNIIASVNKLDNTIDNRYNKLLYSFIKYYKRLTVDKELQKDLQNKLLELKYNLN